MVSVFSVSVPVVRVAGGCDERASFTAFTWFMTGYENHKMAGLYVEYIEVVLNGNAREGAFKISKFLRNSHVVFIIFQPFHGLRRF